MNWTKLFDSHLEKILPVRHVIREPGIPIEIGNSRRTFRADYTFSLAGTPYVVEVKLAKEDMPLYGTKVMAYQKLFNTYTGRANSGLIIARKQQSNSADLMACAMLRLSLLVIDFKEQTDKSIIFTAKLDGSINYQSVLGYETVKEALESNAEGLESHFIEVFKQ